MKYAVPSQQRHQARQPSARGLRGCKGIVKAWAWSDAEQTQGHVVWRPCALPRKHAGDCAAVMG